MEQPTHACTDSHGVATLLDLFEPHLGAILVIHDTTLILPQHSDP